MLQYEGPEGTWGFSKKDRSKSLNCAIRSNELVIRSIELDNLFSRIAYLLTYQTPMAGDLLLCRMKKQEIKCDDYFELKILVNKKNKHMIQTLS